MAGIVDYSQVATATWAYVRPQMAHAAFTKTTACNWLRKRGAIQIKGGEQAEFITELGGPAIHGHVERGEQLSLESQQILDKSRYPWREHAVLLRVEHRDLAANAGPYQQANLLEAIRKNGMKQAGDDLEKSLFGVAEDDTLVGTSIKYPINAYDVAAENASNVGGISVTTWPRWKPGHVTDKAAVRPSELDLTSMLVDLTSEEGGMPQVTFTDSSAYKDLYRIVAVRRRQNNALMADLGYKGFTWEGVDFLHVPHRGADGLSTMARGLGVDTDGAPSKGFVYLTIDPKHFFIVPHASRFMMPSEKIPVAGLLADVYHIETQYTFGTDHRAVQGVVYADADAR